MINTKFLMCKFFNANFKIKILRIRYFFNTNLEINIFMYCICYIVYFKTILIYNHTIYDHLYLVITKKVKPLITKI